MARRLTVSGSRNVDSELLWISGELRDVLDDLGTISRQRNPYGAASDLVERLRNILRDRRQELLDNEVADLDRLASEIESALGLYEEASMSLYRSTESAANTILDFIDS